MVRYYFRKIIKNERGAAAVEFAIVAVLLFTLIFGIIEFGWIFNGYVTLVSAAQEGARAAIVMENINENEVKDIVRLHARIFQLDGSDITITPAGPGGETAVEVNGKLDLLIAFPPFPTSINLQARATMRQEQ